MAEPLSVGQLLEEIVVAARCLENIFVGAGLPLRIRYHGEMEGRKQETGEDCSPATGPPPVSTTYKFVMLPLASPSAGHRHAASAVADLDALERSAASAKNFDNGGVRHLEHRRFTQPSAGEPDAGVRRLLGVAAGLNDLVQKSASPVVEFLDSCLRGVGQVFFCNNPVTGLLFLAALAVDSWYSLVSCLIGVVSGTAVAVGFGFDPRTVRAGLMGYNPTLAAMGLAYFCFGSAANPFPLPQLVVGMAFAAGLAAIFTASVGSICGGHLGIPTFTFPFHAATWGWMLMSQLSAYFSVNGSIVSPSLLAMPSTVPTMHAVEYSAVDCIRAVFASVSQVFFLNNPYSGAVCVVAIAVCSPIMGAASVFGAAIGVLVAVALGMPAGQIYAGLWGYNPVLTAIALGGMFFVPLGLRWAMFVLYGVVATAVLHGTVVAFLSPAGMPALTFPFTLVCWLFCLLGGSFAHDEIVFVEPALATVPEDHRRRFRLTRSVRLASAGLLDGTIQIGRLGRGAVEQVEKRIAPALLCIYAAHRRRDALVECLSLGVDINAGCGCGRTVLHCASSVGDRWIVDLLLRRGADAAAPDLCGRTPLIDAVLLRAPQEVVLSLARSLKGASLRIQDSWSWSPWVSSTACLCAAAHAGDAFLLRSIIIAGADVNEQDFDGQTALHVAAFDGNEEIVSALLLAGANPTTLRDGHGRAAVDEARLGGHASIAEALAQRPVCMERSEIGVLCLPDDTGPAEARPHSPDASCLLSMLLSEAASRNDVARLAALVSAESFGDQMLSLFDCDRQTPLHVAAACGATEAVRFLLAHPLSASCLHRRDRWGAIPLWNAVMHGHDDICELLWTASPQAPPDKDQLQLSSSLRQCLCAAVCLKAAEGSVSVIPRLFRYKLLDPSSTFDYACRSPLHFAAAFGHAELVSRLVDVGCNVAVTDRWGRTAEAVAVANGRTSVAELLRQRARS